MKKYIAQVVMRAFRSFGRLTKKLSSALFVEAQRFRENLPWSTTDSSAMTDMFETLGPMAINAAKRHLADLEAERIPHKDKPNALHHGLIKMMLAESEYWRDAYLRLDAAHRERADLTDQSPCEIDRLAEEIKTWPDIEENEADDPPSIL